MRFGTTLCGFGTYCFLSLVVALGATGCGSSTGSVAGKVTLNGQPLKGGNVTFVGKESFAASIQEDGTYNVPRLLAGEYKVCVETESLKPKNALAMMPGMNNKTAKAKPLDAGTNVPEGYKPHCRRCLASKLQR